MARAADVVIRSGAMNRVAAPTVIVPEVSPVQWGPAIRGALLLLFGVSEGVLILFAFRVPNITVREMVMLLTVFLVADGAVALWEAARGRQSARRLLASEALLGVAAGVALLILQAPWSVPIFAVWVIVTGVLDAMPTLTASPAPGRIVIAVLSLAYGVLALAGPLRDRALLLLVGAAYSVIVGSLRLRRAMRSADRRRVP